MLAPRIDLRTAFGWFVIAMCVSAAGFAAAARADEGAEKSRFPAWETFTKDATKLDGLFPLYFDEKQQKLYMEIRPDQYGKDILCPITIARGAGGLYLGGDTLNFGDQWVFNFRRAADRILLVRKNIYFQAKSGTPQADAVRVSYNDSIVLAMPVRSEQGGKVLVDLADMLMTDLANIGIRPDPSRSTWGSVKAFPQNVGIEVNAVFPLSFGGFFSFFGGFFGPEIPDTRGAQVVIHYGLSMLPSEGDYKPRAADDRVGHFLSVLKDYSSDKDKTAFVRYVTRWNLVKADASAEKSPPKEPIIFWIEKSVPREYRPYVKAGILEWNKAFDKIGFIEAIQVRDQQPGDDFDPEDIRFNTFRWITTSSAFAMGPSRTNPLTGQILDADILFDEAMVRYWRQEYLTVAGIPNGLERLAAGEMQAWLKLHAAELPTLAALEPQLNRWLARSGGLDALVDPMAGQRGTAHHRHNSGPGRRECCALGPGVSRQLGLLAASLAAAGAIPPGGKVPEEFIGQAIKYVTMHEVGHTLGLRHNFKSSSILSLADASNPEVVAQKGMAGSVMDYLPANLAAKGEKQGPYFTPTLGPYDYWAIEYAYKPVDKDDDLAKIASRVAEPDLLYGTDEDLFYNPDPRVNVYDLGDPLDYAKARIELVKSQIDDLAERVVAEGDGWQQARGAFENLLSELAQATSLAVGYVGGEYTYRDHRGDPNARAPYDLIPIEKSRQAIELVREHVLSDKAFQFPPELLKRLAPEYWSHWGMGFGGGGAYPLNQQALGLQRMVLAWFLSPGTLANLQNMALHSDDPGRVLAAPEVFDALTAAIWSELPGGAVDSPLPEGKLALSAIRRNLQREHVRRLSQLVVGSGRGSIVSFEELMFINAGSPPADARTLARMHLRQIQSRLERSLAATGWEKDAYSQAHLEELKEQIDKVLSASLQASEP